MSSYTIEDLAARSERDTDHTTRSDRSVTHYWILPDSEADAHGTRPTAKLWIHHDKGQGYRATLSETDFAVTDFGYAEAFTFASGRASVRVLAEDAARFNRKRFVAFAENAWAAVRRLASA